MFNRASQLSWRRLSFSKVVGERVNFERVVAEWILVLKLRLCSRALRRGLTLCFEKKTSSPLKVGLLKILARATQEFQAILGLLLSKLSRMIIIKVSKVKLLGPSEVDSL